MMRQSTVQMTETRARRRVWGSAAALIVCVAGCETINNVTASVTDTVKDAVTPPPPGKREVDVYAGEPDVRVRIAKSQREAAVSGPQRFVVRAVAGSRSAVRPASLPGPLMIVSGDRGVVVREATGKEMSFGFGVDVEVLASDGTPDGAAEAAGESIYLAGKAYPGFLTIRPSWNDTPAQFDVTVSMPVEAYLPGVLSKELIKDWPRQAFEAQAVAARTYALQERSRARREGRTSDVEDSTADQVFGGTSNLVVAVEATRATRGMVLTDNGKLIRAYFSSTCGGRPASAAETWPMKSGREFNKAGPLQGQPRTIACQRAPLYRWTVIRPLDDVTARLRAFGRGKKPEMATLGRLRTIQPATRNSVQRPNTYTIADSAGHEYTLTAEELREALNWPLTGFPPITRENRIHSGDFEVLIYGTEVRFAGRGFGHGVGLCQWCAKGMADSGMDWRSMIEQFYPGATVIKLY